jgi:hypothetical protein
LAWTTDDAFPISPSVRTRMASLHTFRSNTLPISRIVAKIQSQRCIAFLLSTFWTLNRSTNGHPSMSFRSHQNSDHLPSIAILPTSSDEYRLPSIGIRNQLPAKHVSSRRLWARHLSHDACSAFAFSRCSQPTVVHLSIDPTFVGTNLRRRSDSMLQRPFDRRNTLATCIPFCGTLSVGSSSPQSVSKHPLYADAFRRPSAPKPEDCWLLSVLNLELLPASLYHPV